MDIYHLEKQAESHEMHSRGHLKKAKVLRKIIEHLKEVDHGPTTLPKDPTNRS